MCNQTLVATSHRSFCALHMMMSNSYLFNSEINYLGSLQITKRYGQIASLHFSATKSVIHPWLCLPPLSFVYNITDHCVCLLHVKCMQSCINSTRIPYCLKLFLSIFFVVFVLLRLIGMTFFTALVFCLHYKSVQSHTLKLCMKMSFFFVQCTCISSLGKLQDLTVILIR